MITLLLQALHFLQSAIIHGHRIPCRFRGWWSCITAIDSAEETKYEIHSAALNRHFRPRIEIIGVIDTRRDRNNARAEKIQRNEDRDTHRYTTLSMRLINKPACSACPARFLHRARTAT